MNQRMSACLGNGPSGLVSRSAVEDRFSVIVRRARYALLRYETIHTRCTGITGVTEQERRHFQHGIMVAPWCHRMASAQTAVASGEVRPNVGAFMIAVDGRPVGVRVHMTTRDDRMTVLYLDVDREAAGHLDPDTILAGVDSPYDTPHLRADALFFGLAVEGLIAAAAPTGITFVHGADWETVPALHLLQPRLVTALALHNAFDAFLGLEAGQFDERYRPFTRFDSDAWYSGHTALRVGLQSAADVVTAVNQGFAHGLRSEILYTRIIGAHLQEHVHRIVGNDNGRFSELRPEHLALAHQLGSDDPIVLELGLLKLEDLKRKARATLPADLQAASHGKILMVTMGRRVAQKQHDVLVESLRRMLRRDPSLPIFMVFATVPGDGGSTRRLARIQALAEEFPSNVAWLDGPISFFEALMEAADFHAMAASLWEPHGGAYSRTAVPISRGVDGLAAQIRAFEPVGLAREINDFWHRGQGEPSGIVWRETPCASEEEDLRALLIESPSPSNSTFWRMVEALEGALDQAIQLRLQRPDAYARLVGSCIRVQERQSWKANFDRLMELVEAAGARRGLPISAAP